MARSSSGLIALILGGIGLLALSRRGGATPVVGGGVDAGDFNPEILKIDEAIMVETYAAQPMYPVAAPGAGFVDPYSTTPTGEQAISYWFPGIGVVSKEGYAYLEAARLSVLAEQNAGGG